MAKKINKSIKRIRHRSHSVRRLSSSSNAIAPSGVASIFHSKTKHTMRLEPYTMDRVAVERPATSPRPNNWLNPFRSVCADRKERRSVLFAKGKAGAGKRIHTPKTYSIRSAIKCK